MTWRHAPPPLLKPFFIPTWADWTSVLCPLPLCPSVCLSPLFFSLRYLSSLSSPSARQNPFSQAFCIPNQCFYECQCQCTELPLSECVCVWAFLCVSVWRWIYVVQSDLHPPGMWLIEPAVKTRLSHTLLRTHTCIHTLRDTLNTPLFTKVTFFLFFTSCLRHLLHQKWAPAHERLSLTGDPTINLLTPPHPTSVSDGLSILYPYVAWCLCICILLAVILSLYLPLSPFPFLTLFYFIILPSVSLPLSFCPLQANPQTSIRSKQGSLTFNFLLATHFSFVCASPFLGLFLCQLNRWMDGSLDD